MELQKVCIYCEKLLPFDAFRIRKDTGNRDGACKDCKKARASAYYRENLDQHHASVKKRYDSFGRFRRYGITAEQYDAALGRQKNCCALCKAQKPGGKGKWHIDHRHVGPPKKGFNQTSDGSLFRGILCHKCNISLGHYEKLLGRVDRTLLQSYLAVPE